LEASYLCFSIYAKGAAQSSAFLEALALTRGQSRLFQQVSSIPFRWFSQRAMTKSASESRFT
jgi:hypothetical protein